ncbi:MAG: competence/damage-inducible protein A [Candidatus Melainabacteria bacterium]|nr:competence/damage-inducible protein A [Candidatus Melainabacteria bacterium]
MPVAEIIAIGTEILLGQITDTNSRFISAELAGLGIDCFFHTTVGDNRERIVDCIRTALSRSDLVITTGGLGPTPDDLTMECIAEALGAPMVSDALVLAGIEEFFSSRHIAMPDSNKKQALRPEGSRVLPNSAGTAPGIIWEIDSERLGQAAIASSRPRTIIMTFPGVPHELVHMWHETAAPYLMREFSGAAIFSVELKHIGIGESTLAQKYEELLSGINPTVAPYAGRGECRLRVTAKAPSLDEARIMVQPVADRIRRESGHLCYGQDEDTLESVVARLLLEAGLTVALAESCTGGLVSKRLTDVPGSSRFIGLNLVTYSNQAKIDALGVEPELLDRHGAVSPECARAMAEGARNRAGSDIGIGITGIAGPDGGTDEKPVGLVYLALSAKDGGSQEELRLGARSSRTEIRYRTASAALNMLRLFLLDHY